METPAAPTIDPALYAAYQQRMALQNRFRNGVGWFYWVAALSVLNSVIFLAGGKISFLFGLGATQVVDGVMMAIVSEMGSNYSLLTFLGFALNLVISGVFALISFFGQKRHSWVIILGLVIYVIDGLILLFFESYLDALFHLWVIYGVWNGLKALKQLKQLDEKLQPSAIQAV